MKFLDFLLLSCWFLVTLCLASEQPGALSIYPPTLKGEFEVDLDHFRFNDETMKLRYFAYDKFRKLKDAPVFLYCGNEGNLEGFYDASGGIFEMAANLEAVVIFVEHRYYGLSLPMGNQSFTKENLVYLSIEQALADYAQLIHAFPHILNCKSMLAAWHRFKYPHLSIGAVASGAPVDFYSNEGIQKAFEDAYVATFESSRLGCGHDLQRSINLLEKAEAKDLLAAGVKSCQREIDVESFKFYAKGAISSLAMIDYPYPCNFIAPLPANPVKLACDFFQDSSQTLLQQIVNVVNLYVNSSGALPCFDLDSELLNQKHRYRMKTTVPLEQKKHQQTTTSLGTTSWNYQACTELILEPITSDGYGFYPPKDGKETDNVINSCMEIFDVRPRPNWMALSFGFGEDVVKNLKNVIFMENSKDPWHVGTKSIRNNTANGLYRVIAKDGAHHQDLRFHSKFDSPEVQAARKFEKDIISDWLGIPTASKPTYIARFLSYFKRNKQKNVFSSLF